MFNIWNPWHGCVKCSEGCENCYMFYLDRKRGRDGSEIYKTKSGFTYPLHRDRNGRYKIRSGETIHVCLNSDFLLPEADAWRDDAWEIMRQRPDVKFFLLTKRPERALECLPDTWGEGWENISFSVTCENQRRADERIPILLSLPFKHKGVMCAPYIERVSIEKYLSDGQIERVLCGGENYDGARPCDFDWVKSLREECVRHGVTFRFVETGTVFIKDGKRYHLPNKQIQSEMAYKSGMNFDGKPQNFILTDMLGLEIPKEDYPLPHYGNACLSCPSRSDCSGCNNCGSCAKKG